MPKKSAVQLGGVSRTTGWRYLNAKKAEPKRGPGRAAQWGRLGADPPRVWQRRRALRGSPMQTVAFEDGNMQQVLQGPDAREHRGRATSTSYDPS